MKRRMLTVLMFFLATSMAWAEKKQEVAQPCVGRIMISGNTCTSQAIILRQFGLFPGWPFNICELVEAQKNLARLNLFRSRPKVTILNPDSKDEFKDILITVEEKRDPNSYGCICLRIFEDYLQKIGLWELVDMAEERRGTCPAIGMMFDSFETMANIIGILSTGDWRASK